MLGRERRAAAQRERAAAKAKQRRPAAGRKLLRRDAALRAGEAAHEITGQACARATSGIVDGNMGRRLASP